MASTEWYFKNRERMRELRKKWYDKNKESERSKAIVRQRIRRQEFNKWYYEYKSKLSCIQCGFSHPAAIDFHHRERGEKEFDPSHMRNLTNKKRFLKEIEKCDVLCANCHRILHYNEVDKNIRYESL
jgi:hypothetical protein